MRHERTLEPYDPAADLARRWPDWSVYESTELPAGREQFSPATKAAFVKASDREADWVLAHVTAHLDLGHHHLAAGGGFTPEQESQASWLAALRMDRPPELSDDSFDRSFHEARLRELDEPPSPAR